MQPAPRYRQPLRWLLAAIMLGGSCATVKVLPSSEEVRRTIELGRSRVLSDVQGLDEASRAMVATNDPKFATYRMGGDYAQYTLSWPISSNRVLRLWGEGNVKTLEGSAITIDQPSKTGRP